MTNITTIRPGEHFMFKDFEWICLDPNHPDGGLLAIMAKPWANDMKFCPSENFVDGRGNWNNYPTICKRGTACINKDGQWVLDTEMPILKGENRDYVNQYIFVGE